MKATGIVRKIDDLGRIVIPKETRKVLGIEAGDSIEIFTEGETLILKKYEPYCIFCGEASGVVEYKGKKICKSCLKELKR
jgi:transcriptional pleiotropic regulator of transition state genes